MIQQKYEIAAVCPAIPLGKVPNTRTPAAAALVLATITCVLLMLGACRHGDEQSTGGGGGTTTGSTAPAPTGLSYTSPVTAVVSTAITSLSPTVSGTVTSYSVSPALPGGLALDTSSGVISGTPTATAAQATYTVTATNASGNTSFDLSLTVNPAAPSGLSYTSPVQETVGIAITRLTPTVTGTVASYSVNPDLPAGLSLDSASGAISGTPSTAAAQANYTLTATNVTGSATFQLALSVTSAATTQPADYTPTSTRGLVQAALLQGQIDLPTSLMYRIWAQFYDSQLPPQYDGAGEGEEDAGLFDEIQLVWNTLPANAQAAIQPYLLRPTDPASPFSGGATTITASGIAAKSTLARRSAMAAGRRDIAAANITPCSDWVFTSSTVYGGFFKIWTCHTSDADDQVVFTAVDNILSAHWEAMTKDMGIPRRDDGSGGDDSMDVYILDVGECMMRNTQCYQFGPANTPGAPLAMCPPAPAAAGVPGGQSAYLLVRKSRARMADLSFEADVVHEFFHALQYAHISRYSRVVRFPSGQEVLDRSWFVEASAKWAEWAYVPQASPKEVKPWYAASYSDGEGYSDAFYQPGKVSLLTDSDSQHPYASFVWPYFMQQAASDSQVVGRAWKGAEFASGPDQINQSINAQLNFASNFGDFMVRNLNNLFNGDPLQTHFWDLDKQFSKTPHPIISNPELFPSIHIQVPTPKQDQEFTIENLAANYLTVTVQPGNAGVTHLLFALDTDPTVIDFESVAEVVANPANVTWKRFSSPDNKTLEFCLADPNQDIDKVILMLGNSQFTYSPSQLAPLDVHGTLSITADGNCGEWSGYIKSVYKNLTHTETPDEQGTEVDQSYEIMTQIWTIAGSQKDPNFPSYQQLRYNWTATDVVNDTYDLYAATSCGQSTRHTSTTGSASMTASFLYDVIPSVGGAWSPGNPPSTTTTPDPTKTWTPVYDQVACDGTEITDNAGSRTISNQLFAALQSYGSPIFFEPDPNDPTHYVGSNTYTVAPGITETVTYDIRHRTQ
jgi:Putative Ig domain